MNKITTLLLFSILSSVSVLAQDDASKKTIRESVTAEVNFNPFSSSPVNIKIIICGLECLHPSATQFD